MRRRRTIGDWLADLAIVLSCLALGFLIVFGFGFVHMLVGR